MAKHVVCPASEIAPGGRRIVEIAGRSIGLFNLDGEFFALRNRCPHQGAELCTGQLGGLVTATAPGCYDVSRPGEMLRCPWHGWEFDVRTGQSWFDPHKVKVRSYPTELVKGPYLAESYPVTVERELIVVEL